MNISIKLPPDIQHRLDALVAKTGRSRDSELRAIIELGLEDAEDYQSAVEAMDRLQRGEDEVISEEEFWRDLEN